MSEKRLTCAYGFYPDEKTLEKLNTFYGTAQSSVLAVINEKPHKAFYSFESAAVIECVKAKKYDVARWIKAECGKFGVIADGAAELLAEYCNCDMVRVENETRKLIAYVGDGNALTEDAVKELVAKDAEYEIYKMTDYIAQKKFDDAVKTVKDMLNKGETPIRLISSIYRYMRRLLQVKIADMDDE